MFHSLPSMWFRDQLPRLGDRLGVSTHAIVINVGLQGEEAIFPKPLRFLKDYSELVGNEYPEAFNECVRALERAHNQDIMKTFIDDMDASSDCRWLDLRLHYMGKQPGADTLIDNEYIYSMYTPHEFKNILAYEASFELFDRLAHLESDQHLPNGHMGICFYLDTKRPDGQNAPAASSGIYTGTIGIAFLIPQVNQSISQLSWFNTSIGERTHGVVLGEVSGSLSDSLLQSLLFAVQL